MDVLVKFDYNAQDNDELTIRKGDKIKNAFKKEDGWMEGELNGKRGLFPDNYVEIIKKTQMANEKRKNFLSDFTHKLTGTSDKKSGNYSPPVLSHTIPGNGSTNNNNGVTNSSSPVPPQSLSPRPPPVQNKPGRTNTDAAFRAKVVYSYLPANDDELAIQENDTVEVLRLVEDGWYEGVSNGKRGVFPSNYVIKIDSNEKSLNSSTDEIELEDKKANRKVVGVGLGNIFSGKPIELKTTNLKGSQNGNYVPIPPNATQIALPKPAIVTKARVIFNYKPAQPDELQLQIGEIINVLDKNLDDEGWWKGEINGRVGVFPDNFVEEIVETSATSNNNKKLNNSSNNLIGTPTSTPPPPIMNTTANFTNTNTNLENTNNALNKESSKLQVSSSASSSTSSLVTTPSNGQAIKDESSAVQATTPPPSINNNIQNNSEPTSNNPHDDALKLDDMQSDSKLTHLKKTRQFNKRPPSFRLKSKGEKIEDAESLIAQLQPASTPETNGNTNGLSDSSKQIANHTSEKKRDDLLNQSTEQMTPLKTPSPPPPPYTSPINPPTNGTANMQTSNEEIKHFRQEIDFLKELTNKLVDENKHLQNEIKTQKQTYDDQFQKFQKKLKELIEEIDDEKKTRLALQVELERIKKSVTLV